MGGANGGSSGRGSDAENWARITERPEEEEVANIESREVTQEEIYIPHAPSPSPASELPKDQGGLEEKEEAEDEDIEDEKSESEKKVEDDRKSHSTPRSRSIALQTDSEVGSHRDITTAGRMDETPRRSGNDADDEDEGEEEGAEGKWPGQSREKEHPQLDTLREESATLHSSRRPSSVSKDDISRTDSTSKNASALGARSKAESALGEGGAVSASGEDGKDGASPSLSKSPIKSSAASRTSVRKSVDGAAPAAGKADSRKSSVAPSRTSGAAPGGKSAASSAAAKSKIKSGATEKSGGDRSVSSSATPAGRETSPSKSQSKPAGGDKSVSGRSSKKSSAAKQRLESQTAGGKSRATTGKNEKDVEEEEAVDNPWDDEEDDNLDEAAALGAENGEGDGAEGRKGSGALEDVDEFRNRSTPSEDNARVSGEDSGVGRGRGGGRGGGGLDLAIQGEQLFTPPETPGVARRKSGPGSCDYY